MLRSPLVQLVVALAITLVAGAYVGGEIFRGLSRIEPTLFVRLSFGIAACCAFGFVVTLYRVLRGLPPITVAMPSPLSNAAAFVVAILSAVIIATTVFR